MTVRTLTGGFCPKRGCCLATGLRKWRENENLTIFSVSGAVLYYLNRWVSNAESWVSRPSFILFRLAVSDFWKMLPLTRCRGLNAKLLIFLHHIFSVFIFLTNKVNETTPIFLSACRAWQGLSTLFFSYFLSWRFGYGRIDLMKNPINFLRYFLDLKAITLLLSTFADFFDWLGCEHGWWAKLSKFCAFGNENRWSFTHLTMLSKLCYFARSESFCQFFKLLKNEKVIHFLTQFFMLITDKMSKIRKNVQK